MTDIGIKGIDGEVISLSIQVGRFQHPDQVYPEGVLTEVVSIRTDAKNGDVAIAYLPKVTNLELITGLENAQKALDPFYQSREDYANSRIAAEIRQLYRWANQNNNPELHEFLQSRMAALPKKDGPILVQS